MERPTLPDECPHPTGDPVLCDSCIVALARQTDAYLVALEQQVTAYGHIPIKDRIRQADIGAAVEALPRGAVLTHNHDSLIADGSPEWQLDDMDEIDSGDTPLEALGKRKQQT